MDNDDWNTKIRPQLYVLKWQGDALAREDAEKIIDKKWLEDHGYNFSAISIPRLLTDVAEGCIDPPICPAKAPPAEAAPVEAKAKAPTPGLPLKALFKKKSAARGPVAVKRNAAADKLRDQFRTKGLKEIDLGPRQDGGLTTKEISKLIGCSRTELSKVMETVLGEREFAGLRKAWRKRDEGQKKRPGKWSLD